MAGRMVYIPKMMTYEQLKGEIEQVILNRMKVHFKVKPKSTTFKVNKRLSIRRHGNDKYTIHVK